MFFEATYVPSPPLSIASIDEGEVDLLNDTLANDSKQQRQQEQEPDIEPTSDKPVDHLIFVIHGIGQQTEQYGHFYEHIENLQETTRQVLQAKVPDHNVRIELIPIEWHRHIHEQVDPIINKITLKSIPTIRLIENDYLADVLFYFSKDRGQNIIDNVTNLFNTSYHNFMEKHPNFDGKIVIMGYSLGGIIVWDILSHQRKAQGEEEEKMYNKLDIKFEKLDFKPHYFFGLGSPVGAVLTFRGQDPKLYHPDFDIQFENVFHPFDPLGYRFEPLFNDYYTDKPAVLVERSVPIGPSFSFPSMPSFPLSAGFLSFFSWKGEDKGSAAAKTLYNTTSEAAETNKDDLKQEERQVAATAQQQQQQQQGMTSPEEEETGFMSTLMSYFSKGGGTKKKKVEEEQKDDLGDIVPWNPLKEQTREQLLALRDDLNRTLNNTSMHHLLQAKRPPMKMRSKTFAHHHHEEGGYYSTSLEQNSDGSVATTLEKTTGFIMTSSKSHTTTATCSTTASSSSASSMTTVEKSTRAEKRIPLRKTMTEHPKRHHLVEVLGIDGLRVDSFERPSTTTRLSFDNKEQLSQQVKKDDQQGDSGKPNLTKQDTNTRVNADGGNNLWLDLNNELNRPGPAITSPGESRADVAQDATVPKSSHVIDQDSKQTDLEEEEEERMQLAKLPGQCRMDYVLQPDSVMSMIANEYLIGLRAHFSYWTNKDLLWHMLRRIENLEVSLTTSSLDEVGGKNKSSASLSSSTIKVDTTKASGDNNLTTTTGSAASISIDDTHIVKKKK